MRRALLLTLALMGILAPGAQAGTPFTIGEGRSPHLIVDAAGTAHVTWHDETKTIFYCRIPRDATRCPAVQTLTSSVDGDTFLVAGGGSTLHLVQPYYPTDQTFQWTSTDNGATWGPQQQIYKWGGGTDTSEPVFGPQPGQLTFASTNPDVTAWAASVDGSESASEARATLGGASTGYNAQVAPTEDGGLVLVSNDLENTYFHRMAPGGDPSNTAAWSARTLVGAGAESRVAGGPGGTYILSTVAPTNPHQDIRKWNGTGFGPPLTINEYGYINDIFVSPSGGVAAIWRLNDPSGNRLRMAFSNNGGASFTMRTIAIEDVVMADMDVALPADNRGWATYEGGAGSNGARALIRVTSTDPIVENVVSPDPPAVKRDTERVPGATLTLSAPGTCIQPEGRFTANVAVRKTRRIFRGVVRVAFLFGNERAKLDRKRPFRKRLSLRRGVSGQKYALKAIVRYRLRGSTRLRTKTLRVIIEACPQT